MEASRATLAARPAIATVLSDYVTLTKPRVQLLLLLTTITTMYVAGDPSVALVAITVVGGSLSAGGAAAVHHYYDRGIDAAMARTATRPVPAGRVSPRAALVYALTLQVASFLLLALAVNVLSATLALLGFLWYTGVYTVWLKRRSPQNIVIGGAAGAVPPPVGWGAGTGSGGPGGAVPLRDRLLLDAAALLGAVAADEGRVRARRRADDAGGPRRDGDAPADRPVHLPPHAAHAAAGGLRLLRRGVRRRRLRAGRRVHRAGAGPVAPGGPAQLAARLPHLARLSGGAGRRHGPGRPPVDSAADGSPPRPPQPAHRLFRRHRRPADVRADVRRRPGLQPVIEDDLNGGAPPVGEEIHMPAPSILPLINAAGLAFAIVSITLNWYFVVVGGIVFLVTALKWIGDVRRDIADLPLEHH